MLIVTPSLLIGELYSLVYVIGMKEYPSRAAKKVRYHRLFVLILR
jgi:hypothetical protein